MSDWTHLPDANPGALTPTPLMQSYGITYEMLGLFRQETSVDSMEGKTLLNENLKQIAETLRSLAPSERELEIKSKSADYTTTADDFGDYVRFTAEATLTLHTPVADDVGKSFLISNVSEADTVTVSTAATLNGGTLTEIAAGTRVVLLVSADGEYDVFS
jgi:hypothetical protein